MLHDASERHWARTQVGNRMVDPRDSSTALVDGLGLDITRVVDESVVIEELLDLDGKQILELGCGRAKNTRAIAQSGIGRTVLALEVDQRQHELNLQTDGLSNVTFALGGAEAIPAADASCDVVFLFKSLHHVPIVSMPIAMAEITRVLKPGGYAYVSEPLFRGRFNECLRLFHDESLVRDAAFQAIKSSVRSGQLDSVQQTFFLAPVCFTSFDEFEHLVIRATHSDHVLSDDLLGAVRRRFLDYAGPEGVIFEQPIRVDLLRRPVCYSPRSAD